MRIHSLVFRESSFLPIAGYLILYGDAFQSWFQFSVLGQEWLFTTSVRLHLLYWGGVFIFAAAILHISFCPGLVKRFPDQDEYVENFISAYSPRPVIEAIHSLSILTYGIHSRGARFTNLFNPIARAVGSSDDEFIGLAGKGISKLDPVDLEKLTIRLRYLLDGDRNKLEAQIFFQEVCKKSDAGNYALSMEVTSCIGNIQR